MSNLMNIMKIGEHQLYIVSSLHVSSRLLKETNWCLSLYAALMF